RGLRLRRPRAGSARVDRRARSAAGVAFGPQQSGRVLLPAQRELPPRASPVSGDSQLQPASPACAARAAPASQRRSALVLGLPRGLRRQVLPRRRVDDGIPRARPCPGERAMVTLNFRAAQRTTPLSRPLRRFANPDVVSEGWYAVGAASAIRRGKVVSVSVGRHDVILYRDLTGVLRAADRACPHLGADLGMAT